jgi:superfamily II DNA or RNA helicase
MPTGAGKTATFAEIVKMAAEKGTKVVVLTDRIELFKQTYSAINRAGVSLPVVEMVETYNNKIKKGRVEEPELIIADECHKANFTKIIQAFPFARVLGITATPVGKHFHKVYQNLVAPIDIPELIAQEYLSPAKAFQMKGDFSDLEVKRGEFTEQSQYIHFSSSVLFDGVIAEYKAKAKGSTVVFNCNIAHTVEMTKAFNEAGIASECITSLTSDADRARILLSFELGLFQVLNNCGILTTGWDCPRVETIIVNRATMSLPLWLQMCGRGSRKYEGKEYFTILDFGKNHDRHGRWDEPRTWTLAEPKKKKQGIAPIKECPNCGMINHATAKECKCGFEFQQKDKPLAEGIMVEVSGNEYIGKRIADLSIFELSDLAKRKKYKATFIWRIVRSRGYDAIHEYAHINGYSDGWVYRQLQDIHNSDFKNYLIK